MFYKSHLILVFAFFLAACGGGATNNELTWSALTIFSDGAGVASGKTGDGREALIIAPDIVAEVAASNATGASDQEDISEYPIVSRTNGYNIRQGAITSGSITANVLLAEKVGSDQANIVYLSTGTADALASYSATLNSTPVGSFIYKGIYTPGGRNSSFAEFGSLNLSANFSTNTFIINGQSESTSLTGSGFIDSRTGRISSGQLSFVSPYGTNYSATTYGSLGNGSAQDVSGVFHTNDTDPDYAGAYSGSR